MDKPKGGLQVEQRYSGLRFIAGFLQVFGYIMGVLGVFGAIGSFLVYTGDGDAFLGILTAIGGLLGTGITVLYFIAAANSIKIIIDMEENTRRTYMLMERMLYQQRRDQF